MNLKNVAAAVLISTLLCSTFILLPQDSHADQQLPDLIITDVRSSEGQICYTIKNAGQAGIGIIAPVTFWNALFIDGNYQSSDEVSISLAPGGQLDRCFSYQWQMSQPQHTIQVCADWGQNVIEESNEQNNCLEEVWAQSLPDLVVDKIECGPGNKLAVTVKNTGSASLPAGWSALARVYFNAQEQGFFSLGSPTSTSGGGIENPGGSSYYLLSWDITEQVTVMVIADYTYNVTESNEQNNSKTEILETTPSPSPSPSPSPTSTPTPSPTPFIVPTAVPTVIPTSTPVPTSTSTPAPTPTPEITPASTPQPAPQPLRIISGPDVTQITSNSAVISWQTDRPCDSRVRYDSRWGKYASVAEEQKPTIKHSITLAGLQSATTYHFTVESTDAEGYVVRSRDRIFSTGAPQDSRKPSVTLDIPGALSGKAAIDADAGDDTGVDGVTFYLDGEPVYTDYSTPFKWECDTRVLDDGSHRFGARAFDGAGNIDEIARDGDVRNHFAEELSPVNVEILTPDYGEEVYGSVLVSMEVTHELDSSICYLVLELDGDVVWEEDYDRDFGFCLEAPVFETCVYDFSVFEPGSSHVIEVGAKDIHDNWGWDSRRVSVLEPEVNIFRNVQRNGNYFYIMLTVENTGEIDISDVRISDTNSGFQCIETAQTRKRSSAGDWRLEGALDCEVATGHSGLTCTISTGDLGTLRPDEAVRLEYSAVPVLYSPSVFSSHAIGETLEVSYTADGREYLAEPTGTRWSSSEFINRAIWEADYLIVTKPSALFNSFGAADVNELLSTMAELARDKWGVIGYLPHWALNATFRGLIMESPEGDWNRQLGSFDYMLIVGQEDIVPAFDMACPGFFMSNTGGVIDISDYPYADIGGDERPELKVGRIIGISARELAIPIRTSLNVHSGASGVYNGSDALIVTGYEDTWEAFIKNSEGGKDTLSDMGVAVTVVHTDYYTTRHSMLAEALRIRGADNEGASWDADLSSYSSLELAAWLQYSTGMLRPGTESTFTDSEGRVRRIPPGFNNDDISNTLRRAETIQAERENRGGDYGWSYTYCTSGSEVLPRIALAVKAQTGNQDVIVFLGHGGPGSWACVLDDWASGCPFEPISFGSCRPVVIAWSCLTGDYRDSLGRSIARAFLRSGAAVYIGSTEVSGTGANDETVKDLFWRGWTPDSRIGDAFLEFRTLMLELGQRSFVHEYNFYGDPKFGGL